MTTGDDKMKDFTKAKTRIEVSIGESVKIIRELQELSQNELAALTGIPQSTISAIEHDRVKLGIERAKVLARALKVGHSVHIIGVGSLTAAQGVLIPKHCDPQWLFGRFHDLISTCPRNSH